MFALSKKYAPVATERGVHFYYVNLLEWNDVQEAKQWMFLGLPYVKVRKKRMSIFGRSWLVALYLGDYQKFKTSVLQFGPEDNPFRKVIEEFPGPKKNIWLRFNLIIFGLTIFPILLIYLWDYIKY